MFPILPFLTLSAGLLFGIYRLWVRWPMPTTVGILSLVTVIFIPSYVELIVPSAGVGGVFLSFFYSLIAMPFLYLNLFPMVTALLLTTLVGFTIALLIKRGAFHWTAWLTMGGLVVWLLLLYWGLYVGQAIISVMLSI